MQTRSETNIPVVLVDGHNLLWRSACGFPAKIINPAGIDRTAFFGFFALLRKAATKYLQCPAEWIVSFDGQLGSQERIAEYKDYKAQRPQDDNPAIRALPDVKAGLKYIGIPWIEIENSEADDVIATLINRGDSRQFYIMSTDKDFYQLVSDSVFILNTMIKSDNCVLQAKDIASRHCVQPSQWCDFRALTGDPSDNIAGIPGVGPRTAARLLSDGITLENLETLGRLNGRVGKCIKDNWAELLRTRELIRFRRVPQLPQVVTGVPFSNWQPPGSLLKVLGLW